MHRYLISILFLGCYVPELTTPDSAMVDNVWEEPDNDWPITPPPANLEAEGYEVGQVIPDMRMMDQHGKEVSMWQFYGKIIFFDISAEWCAPCKLLAKETEETQHDYESQGFIYITMIAEDNNTAPPETDVLVSWAEEAGILTAPVVGPSADLRSTLHPINTPYPRLMLIDRNMKIINGDIQPQNDATIRAAIEAAL